MRGWYAFGPALAGGLIGNWYCHRTGRPTVSSDTRRIDPRLFGLTWAAGTGLLFNHLYRKEQ